MEYYAHTDENKAWQLLKDHLQNVAAISEEFGNSFKAGNLAYAVGLLHDIGKYSQDFQNKLRGQKLQVDHSSAGAQEALKLYGDNWGKILAYVISGHHGGLCDYGSRIDIEGTGTLYSRLKKELPDYSSYGGELGPLLKGNKLSFDFKTDDSHYLPFSVAIFIKMLFSCLVDADFLDTEKYVNEKVDRYIPADFKGLMVQFTKHVNTITGKKHNLINLKRNEILQQCYVKAESPKGLFALTVPTGGGKTLSSLAFALTHLLANGMKRIIYVIPYTSIIEQTASIFKNIFGQEVVLEHHYNFDYLFKEDDVTSNQAKLKLASENWDVPIVVTTNVQFFESFFSNKSSRSRKLHNLSDSIIILDEVQMLPLKLLKPCLFALRELLQVYGSSVVMCTATQPAFVSSGVLPKGMHPINIIDDSESLYNVFRRVEFVNIGDVNFDGLMTHIKHEEQALCVVNTKKLAGELFDHLKGENVFYLSTNLTPAHRFLAIEKIKKLLLNGEQCKVISTPLIEAGVDVDFKVVYRELSGLDSIIQSAGRCNREGKQAGLGKTYIFRMKKEYKTPEDIIQRSKVTEEILSKFKNDIGSLEAIDYYFRTLYNIKGEGLDGKKIMDCFDGRGGLNFDFEKAADNFKIIEEETIPIIISNNDFTCKLVDELGKAENVTDIERKLHQYSVAVRPYELKKLWDSGNLELIKNKYYRLLNNDLYDPDKGLVIRDEQQILIL